MKKKKMRPIFKIPHSNSMFRTMFDRRIFNIYRGPGLSSLSGSVSGSANISGWKTVCDMTRYADM